MIKKYLFVYFLLFFNDLISQSLPIENECFIPSYEESIVTGSNMTIFFSPEAYSNFPDLNDEAFVIALGTDSNLLIGSQYVNTNENQTDENQFAISISGDDSTTDEIDGAISNEVIILQLINAGTLYNITLDSQIVYMTNGLLTLNNFSLDELSCNLIGCTDSLAINFDQYANVDDGSCIDVVEGCTQSDAFNFNSSANVDDGSCIDVVEGCTNPGVGNYDPAANTDDGSCITPALCFTVDPDFPCETITSNNMSVLFPASNPVLWNDFESNVEVNDQIAAFYVTGTLINAFLGYSANSSLGNAGGFVWSGSQADVAIFGADVNGGNGFQPGEELLWLVLRAGVVHEATVTYATPNYDGTYQEGSFVTVNSIVVGGQLLEGCMNSNYMEYDPMATSSNPNDCMTLISVGCLDDNSPNYAGADLDVDSIHPYANNYGDAFGENYMIDLNTGLPNAPSGVPAIFSDTSACQPSIIIGCMDPSACSYDPAANVYDPASCSGVSGCTDANYLEFDPSANCDDGSCSELVVLGCTDAEASNYNIDANLDDGSCEYTELVCSNPIALNFNEFDYCNYNISDIDTLTACGGILYDSGGPDGSYISNENHSITIYPENQGEYVSLFFSSFELESCCDYLTIYDGVGVSSPVLQTGSNGTSLNGLTFYASPTNESGALTITFTTDGSVTYPGFSAEIGCTTYGPCFGFDVNVLSTFESEEGAGDASASLDIILGNEPFEILWSTGDTTSSINDLSAGNYSVSITDSLECFAETNFEILVDPEEYLMGDITNISSCNGIFYDSGGPGSNFGLNENLFTRICPDEDGLSSQLIFNEFSISSGQFTVYDGFGISSPILASGSFSDFIGDTLTASISNSTGCLAITFNSSTWFTTSGWEASISCYDHHNCIHMDHCQY